MASSLFGNKPDMQGNGNLIHRFAEFKRQMAGRDPEAMVRQMLAEGRMSQQQFEKLKSQAQSLMTILR